VGAGSGISSSGARTALASGLSIEMVIMVAVHQRLRADSTASRIPSSDWAVEDMDRQIARPDASRNAAPE